MDELILRALLTQTRALILILGHLDGVMLARPGGPATIYDELDARKAELKAALAALAGLKK